MPGLAGAAYAHAGFFRLGFDKLHEVLAAFFREGGNGQADGAAFHQRVEVQLAFIDGAADVMDGARVKGLDEDEAGFRAC